MDIVDLATVQAASNLPVCEQGIYPVSSLVFPEVHRGPLLGVDTLADLVCCPGLRPTNCVIDHAVAPQRTEIACISYSRGLCVVQVHGSTGGLQPVPDLHTALQQARGEINHELC